MYSIPVGESSTVGTIISQQLVTSGSGVLPKPAGATKVLVEVQGGGASAQATGNPSDGAGGAGGYSSKIFSADSVSYTIGAAGSGFWNGGTSSATVAGVSITAGGGTNGSVWGSGGTASGGDVNVTGQSGENSGGVTYPTTGGYGHLLGFGSGGSTTGRDPTPGAMRVTWYK